jgi:hypothetical protein
VFVNPNKLMQFLSPTEQNKRFDYAPHFLADAIESAIRTESQKPLEFCAASTPANKFMQAAQQMCGSEDTQKQMQAVNNMAETISVRNFMLPQIILPNEKPWLVPIAELILPVPTTDAGNINGKIKALFRQLTQNMELKTLSESIPYIEFNGAAATNKVFLTLGAKHLPLAVPASEAAIVHKLVGDENCPPQPLSAYQMPESLHKHLHTNYNSKTKQLVPHLRIGKNCPQP